MQRVLALLAGVTLATTTFTGPALGGRADRFSDTQTSLVCDGLSNDAGTIFVFVAFGEQSGGFADLAFWAAPTTPQTDPPTWITGNSAVLLDGASLMASFDLFEFQEPIEPEDPPFGDPVGEATLTATLSPIGDPQPYSFQDQFGNHHFRVEGVLQELAVSGTLQLPGEISYDLASCFAVRDSFTVFSNNPASFVAQFSDLQLGCGWEIADGFVSLFASAGEFGTFADLFVSDASGDYFGFTEGTLTDTAFSAMWDLFPTSGGGELDPVGSAEAAADLMRTGERINDIFRFGNFKVHTTGEILAADGLLEVTTPDGTQMLPLDAEHCFAADVRITEQFSAARGPRGKPLSNDTPDAAEPIAIGESVTVNTGGTAVDPEEPCLVEGEFELPFGHTAWWTFDGSGGAVLVDTVGSEFDTALGVYTLEGETFVQVGCVDDVDSLLARITVDTEAGVTYYIQAGGFATSSGKLVLSLS